MRRTLIKETSPSDGKGRAWAVLLRYTIHVRRQRYLRRLRILETPLFGVYHHDIYMPDGQDMHDHPWPFFSLILRGGYMEMRADARDINGTVSMQSYRPGMINRMRMTECHRIVSVKPGTRTLVLHGPRSRRWGFFTPEGWIDYEEYRDTGRRDEEYGLRA